jgi:hypothetical protein
MLLSVSRASRSMCSTSLWRQHSNNHSGDILHMATAQLVRPQQQPEGKPMLMYHKPNS